MLGEIAHLFLGKADIVQVPFSDLSHGPFNLGLGQAKVFRAPVIKFFRQVTHGAIASVLDIGQNSLHLGANLGISLVNLCLSQALF